MNYIQSDQIKADKTSSATYCPYRGEADNWYPCIGTACEKGKSGTCERT